MICTLPENKIQKIILCIPSSVLELIGGKEYGEKINLEMVYIFK